MSGWLSRAWRWRLRTRADGVLWSVICAVTGGVLTYVVSSVFEIGTPILRAIGIGTGTLIGGLLGTLYRLPKENGS